MSKTVLTEPTVRIEYIPAHKFIGIRDASVQDYFSFFETRNCDEICGVIESMSHVAEPVLPSHTAGWFYENGKRGYFYGLGVPQDYSGAVPEGFSLFEIPGSYYLAFSHPPFDFLKDCETVIPKVDALAAGFDPKTMGYRWNEAVCQDYQRMSPETTGYEVLRPIKK